MKARTAYLGLTFAEACAAMGKSGLQARNALSSYGLRVSEDGRLEATRSAIEVQDEITERLSRQAPVAPCFRCGCRLCACGQRSAARG